ncbi:MAG: hypothetical protein PWQ29_194 [Verrucomicrobiota bacterium]|jgi:C_GCAxxG_C_C family probable redox protein|nr:hypothetical protein [Verrucomicrobiota bacterium]
MEPACQSSKTMEPLIEEGFFSGKDLNCSETILYAADEVYGWNLPHEALLLAAGFGGGIGGQEKLCGALSGGVMALGRLFVHKHAHESDLLKTIIQEYFALFEEKMGSIDCAPLREKYHTEQDSCKKVIQTSAFCLDRVIDKYREAIV